MDNRSPSSSLVETERRSRGRRIRGVWGSSSSIDEFIYFYNDSEEMFAKKYNKKKNQQQHKKSSLRIKRKVNVKRREVGKMCANSD